MRIEIGQPTYAEAGTAVFYFQVDVCIQLRPGLTAFVWGEGAREHIEEVMNGRALL